MGNFGRLYYDHKRRIEKTAFYEPLVNHIDALHRDRLKLKKEETENIILLLSDMIIERRCDEGRTDDET